MTSRDKLGEAWIRAIAKKAGIKIEFVADQKASEADAIIASRLADSDLTNPLAKYFGVEGGFFCSKCNAELALSSATRRIIYGQPRTPPLVCPQCIPVDGDVMTSL